MKDLAGENPTSAAKQSYLTDDIQILDYIIRHYEDYPIVRHITKNVRTPTPPPPPPQKKNSSCSLLTISEQDVKKILKELSTEKPTGVDMMPPKLVKLAASYLAEPLSQSVNNSIKKGCFRKMQRLPQLPPDKKTDGKNSVLNFRPINALNCFSKVYENILKTQLVEKMINLFSPFISAYR